MTQPNKPSDDKALTPPTKRNARFIQEVADSRDHDQQSGKRKPTKQSLKPAGDKPAKN